MALIKNDVSDQDIENLFDHNDTQGFQESKEDSVIPEELDVTKKTSSKIERPDTYQPDEVHQKKLEIKKKESDILTGKEKWIDTVASVGTSLFKKLAELRQQAQLEEYIAKQRKIPKIDPQAKYKLYNNEDKCNFHVYQVMHVLDDGIFHCACKYCSQEKMFTREQWKTYELENRQYM